MARAGSLADPRCKGPQFFSVGSVILALYLSDAGFSTRAIAGIFTATMIEDAS
jgi:hypothetical protein